MTPENPSANQSDQSNRPDNTEIHTGGGPAIGGNVNAGSDFVGRDKTAIGTQNVYYGLPAPNQPDPSDEPAPGESPFQGLEYFDVAAAPRFFGREQLTADLVALLREQRFLAVIGASGSGKSSLVRAGLVAALQTGVTSLAGVALPVGAQQWLFYLVTPGSRPLDSLAAALTRNVESVTATSTLIDDLRHEPRALHLYASRLLSGQASTGKLLLVVDQFEELFTQCRDVDEQKALIDNLLTASLTYDRTVVIITLRADFYAHCARFDNLRGALERYQKYIGPMNRDELRRAIEEPARLGDWVFEAGLVEQMLDDVGDEPGALPLLSHALLETWKRRQGRRLTHAGYVAAGRVQKAIATSAEATYQQKLTPPQRNLARTLFLRLTEPGEGAQDTRRRVAWADLLPEGMESSEMETVVQRLVDARLLTTSSDAGGNGRFVEVAHEALIREWPTLRGWLDEDREGLLILRRLGEAAEAWQHTGQEAGFLYRGLPLQQAGQWVANHDGRLNATEQRFLLASQQAENAEQSAREQARRREAEQNAQLAAEQARNAEQAKNNHHLLLLRNVLAGLALLALIAMGFAIQAQRNAAEQRDNATEAKQNADNAKTTAVAALDETAKLQEQIQADRMAQVASLTNIDTTLDQYPQRALLLAVEAVQRVSPPAPSSLTTMHDLLGRTGGRRLGEHEDRVLSMAFSRDSKTLASGSDDSTIRLWSLAKPSADPIVLVGHENAVASVAFSPDDKMLASGSWDGSIRLWSLAKPSADPIVLVGHENGVTSVAFSPDGKMLASGSADQTVRLWSLAQHSTPVVLKGHDAYVTSVAFSPDGKTLASGSGGYGEDNTIYLWSLAKPSSDPVVLKGHDSYVFSLAFSPDGKTLASGSWDNTIRLWSLARLSTDSVVLAGHKGYVYSVAFSPDGKTLASGSADRTIRLWSLAEPVISPVVLAGHEDYIFSVAFSLDSKTLASGSADKTIRLWSLAEPVTDPAVLTGHEDTVYSVAFSPDGKTLASGSADKTIRLWSLAESVRACLNIK